MSSVYRIQYGGRAPATPAENTAFHQDLIDALKAEATRCGWSGCAVDSYQRQAGYVSLAIVPGDGPLDLEALRAFKRQRTGPCPSHQPGNRKDFSHDVRSSCVLDSVNREMIRI